MKRSVWVHFMVLLAPFILAGEGFDLAMDALNDRLLFSNSDGSVRLQLGGTLELEGYSFDGPPPALIQSNDDTLLNPRAVFFLDLQAGSQWYGFIQARIDNGFDPSDGDTDMRLDEYALRFIPWRDGRLNIQVGQFATVIGKWVHRHLSWSNAFVTAPLIYENPTRLTDLYPPYSRYRLANPFGRSGYYYNPIIWGPSYATGLAASGEFRQLEWALEMKNASLMSRPELWSLSDKKFSEPTVSGRLAWKPDLRWNFGISASEGSWAGNDRRFYRKDPYRQRVILFDISYAYRHLQVWSEYAYSEFTVEDFENNLITRAWFLEARYKLTPRLSLALRWNEQEYNKVYNDGREADSWGADVQRLDASATWRFNAHLQVQFEWNQYWSDEARIDGTVFATRLTLRF